MRVGIALGSNLAQRMDLLREASRHLQSLHDGSGPFLRSRIYETEPIDCPPGSPAFFNAAVEISSGAPPLDLLADLQRIEIALGRPRAHGYHEPRTIDLDLLYMDQLAFSVPGLTLPHPLIAERLFVLCPLSDICPDRILPGWSGDVRSRLGTFPVQPPAVASL